MCDTMVALGNSTVDGTVVFAKNSDRHPNEAHHLLLIPSTDHEEDSFVQCTYIRVPQVSRTYTVLLAKPFWIWGAEMGANEHGVVIGNEAVFTKVPYIKEAGLIGMDFIRLTLERSQTAWDALQVMIKLLEKYGQSGNCGFDHRLFYHNSYIIADPQEAWVFETAGMQWAAERVIDVRSISNALTIGMKWDLASSDLVNLALEKRWCKKREEFDFSRCYSDFLYTHFSDARKRQKHTQNYLMSKKGQITVKTMMEILRSHGIANRSDWSPDYGITGADVCMHAGFGPIRESQSVGSMVSQLMKNGVSTHWVTGTAAPCTGIFKPVWIEAGLPDMGPVPNSEYDKACLFWRHEMLHREILRDYAVRLPVYKEERDYIENKFVEEAVSNTNALPSERFSFSEGCFQEADAAMEKWLEKVRNTKPKRSVRFYHAFAWRNINRRAKIIVG